MPLAPLETTAKNREDRLPPVDCTGEIATRMFGGPSKLDFGVQAQRRIGRTMQGTDASIDDVRVMVQALAWSGQIRSNDLHLLRGELNVVIDYAAEILESDVQTQNELCIARSLLAINQVVPALQRLERTVLLGIQI